MTNDITSEYNGEIIINKVFDCLAELILVILTLKKKTK